MTAVDLLFFDLVVLLLAPPDVVDVGISLDGPGKGLSSSIESAVIKQFDFIKGQLVNFYFAKTDTVTDQNRVLVWYSTCSAGLALTFVTHTPVLTREIQIRKSSDAHNT